MRGLPLSVVQARLDKQHKHIKVSQQFRDKHGNLRVHAECEVCHYKWTPLKGNMANKHHARGCPKCNHRIPWTKQGIIKRVTKLSHGTIKVHFKYPYKSEKSLVEASCTVCNNSWPTQVENLLDGTGCPYCKGLCRWTPARAKKRIKMIFHGIIKIFMPQGLPKGKNTKITAYCIIHHFTWHPQLEDLLQGYGCRKCANDKLRKQRNISGKRHLIRWYYSQSDIIIPHLQNVLKHYKNAKTKMKCICANCGCIWKAEAFNLVHYEGCPHCFKVTSHGEKDTGLYLSHIGLILQKDRTKLPSNFHYVHAYHLHTSKNGHKRLHADFIICVNHHLIVIEFDGIQHFQPVDFSGKLRKLRKHHSSPRKIHNMRQLVKAGFHTVQKRDKQKNAYCNSHHIKIVRIKNKYGYKNKRIKTLVRHALNNQLIPYLNHCSCSNVYKFHRVNNDNY